MKFLILGAIDTENTKDLELEILKKGHEVAIDKYCSTLLLI